MTRRQTKVPGPLGDRYRVVIESDPMPATGTNQLAFLRHLAGEGIDTGMLNCGPVPFQTLALAHDGRCWVATLEASEVRS